jgi:PAS domain S-box-containing protein
MQFEFSFYTLPLFAAALVSFLVAGYAWRRRANSSALALIVLSLMITQWSIGYALEIAALDLPAMIFWGKFQYIGIATTPLFWLIFAHNHANPGRRMSLGWMSFWALVPAATILLVMTTEWHGLIWGELEIARGDNLTTLGVVSRGWWFWVHFAYSYLLLAAGTYILVRSMWRMRGLYRRQMLVLVISVLAPWVGNILYFVVGVNPDPTPFAFSITVAGMLWGIFGFRLVDVAPLARDLIVEGMRDGMIALDMQARVADINPAAARMIGLPVRDVIGAPITEVLAPWPHLLERFRDVVEDVDDISIGQGEAARHYRVRIAPLADGRGNPIGRLINLRELDQSAPPPRFAYREPITQPYSQGESVAPALPVAPEAESNSVLAWLKNFFLPSTLAESFMPDNMNPSWAQTMERAVTISARFAMIFGSISAWNILSVLNVQDRPGYAATILLFLAGTYFLALVRTAPFNLRVGLFLFLVYVMALVEMLKYGFSADIFVYFMALVVLAHMLLNLHGGFGMLALVVVSMILFAWSVLSGVFVPFEVAGTTGIILPVDMDSAVSNILGYSFAALTMITVINLFIVNLNQAWKKETQALNLVQQERDLLEQRVIDRTADLSEARDLAVQNSNELRKYFRAIEQSGNSIVITNAQGQIEYANPHFEQVTGYTLEEVFGKNPRILKSGTHSVEFYADMWKTIMSSHTWHGEMHNKRKDGSLFWEAATIAAVQNQEGLVTHYVAIKEDITAQKELREKIARQNEYLSILHQTTIDLLNRRNLDDLLNAVVERACALMDVSLGLIALRNEDGAYVFRATTRAQSHMLGKPVMAERMKYTAQVLETGEPVIVNNYSAIEPSYKIGEKDFLHATADFPIIIADEVVGVLALGRTKENYPFTSAQIETGPLFSQMVSLVLDNANLYESALQEIEQRKQAEKLLQESEARFRQIVENASDIIYRADTEGRFTYVNPTALNIMGFKSETEILGQTYLELAKPEWRTKLKRFYLRQFLRGEQNTYFEFEAFTQEGREIWIGQNVQIIKDGDKISGFQAVARDITKLKQAQESLALARDQALEASRFKSQLLAKISHELRTPLGAVIGYAELLQRDLFGPLNNKQKDATDNIVESANYLNIMIGELLDQAQIEARSVQLHILPFSPTELIEHVIGTISILAEKKKLSLVHTIASNLPETLLGDSKRLQQILINLTANAIKFTTHGSVTIELFRPDKNHWAIRVSDTGVGIPPEAQEYIFEAFRQVDNAITHYNRGTGLGLSITKQLVELMGGQISLKSEVNKGSIFTITLPIQA